jgi:hypothetical protein
MSTKIYGGKRIKRERLDEFLCWFYNSCMEMATAHLLSEINNIDKDYLYQFVEKLKWVDEGETVEEYLEKNPEIASSLKVGAILTKCFVISKMSARFGNLDCWCNIFPSDEYFLLIPEFPSTANSHPNFPEWVEEFAYWNSTDKPDNLTDEVWEYREQIWDSVLDNDYRRMNYTVLGVNSVTPVGYWQLMRQFECKSCTVSIANRQSNLIVEDLKRI